MDKISGVTTLPPSVSKAISDSMSSRRKEAALEVEKMVKASCENQHIGGCKPGSLSSHESSVLRLVDDLIHQYVSDTSSVQSKKGGVLCLAAVAVGLAGGKSDVTQSEAMLGAMVPVLLACATDLDTGVRYYGLEAMYNVIKSTKPAVLRHCVEILETLFKVCDDSDPKNQNAAIFVSDLLKDALSDSPQDSLVVMKDILDTLVGFCVPYMHGVGGDVEEAHAQRKVFLLGWFSFIDGLSFANMYFSSIVPNLVPILILYNTDSLVPEVKHPAKKLLDHVFSDIQSSAPGQFPVQELLESLADGIIGTHELSLDLMLSTSVTLAALGWVEELIRVFPDEAWPCHAKLVKCCLKCLDEPSHGDGISQKRLEMACSLNTSLQESSMMHQVTVIESLSLLDIVIEKFGSSAEEIAKLEALRWMALLLGYYSSKRESGKVETAEHSYTSRPEMPVNDIPKLMLLHVLTQALSSDSDGIVEQGVIVLSVLSSLNSSSQPSEPSSSISQDGLALTMRTILTVFDGPDGAVLLKRKGGLILEKLSDLLTSQKLVVALLTELKLYTSSMKPANQQEGEDLEILIIQAITIMLLTSDKMESCRSLLISGTDQGRIFRKQIYNGFSPSISGSLTIAMLSKNYHLAHSIVSSLVRRDICRSTVTAMKIVVFELSQFVSLFESPAFAPTRLDLMMHSYEGGCTALRSCMMSILMILPQGGDAFAALHKRLNLVLSMHDSSSASWAKDKKNKFLHYTVGTESTKEGSELIHNDTIVQQIVDTFVAKIHK